MRISQIYRLAKALILKKMGRPKKIFEAGMLLTRLSQEEVADPETLIKILLNLCDFNLKQFEITNDTEFLEDLTTLLVRLLEIAENEQYFSLQAELHHFQAKFALINLQLEKALEFMTQALHLAQQYHLTRLAMIISQDYDRFLQNQELWETYRQKRASKLECYKMTNIDADLEVMITRKQTEQVIMNPETPLFLLIMSKAGISSYNHFFAESWKNKSLFIPFMSAFNAFSTELFDKTIDRIKIHDNTILITTFQEMLLAYVIKGQSYLAQQKLHRLLEEIKKSSTIMASLQKSIQTGKLLSDQDNPELSAVVSSIFR